MQIYYFPVHLQHLPVIPLYREELLSCLYDVEVENLVLLDNKLLESGKQCRFVTLLEAQNRKQSCDNLGTQLQEFNL